MIDLTFTSMILGQTIWVFFIQSGVLMKFVGRERFVPVMMKITKTIMGVNSTCILGLLATNIAHFQLSNNDANASENLIQFVKSFDSKCITFSLIAALLNEYYVVPKALTVGAMTMKYRIGKDNDQQNTIMAFAKDGGSAFDDKNDSGQIIITDQEKARLGNRMKILHRSYKID